MTNEYERSITIERDPADVFSWVSQVGNLPHYLPPIKEAATEGQAEADAPGEKVRMKGEIPDRGEFEGEGYLSVLEEQRRCPGRAAGLIRRPNDAVSDTATVTTSVYPQSVFVTASVSNPAEFRGSDKSARRPGGRSL